MKKKDVGKDREVVLVMVQGNDLEMESGHANLKNQRGDLSCSEERDH